jgi:hypothetical protein
MGWQPEARHDGDGLGQELGKQGQGASDGSLGPEKVAQTRFVVTLQQESQKSLSINQASNSKP